LEFADFLLPRLDPANDPDNLLGRLNVQVLLGYLAVVHLLVLDGRGLRVVHWLPAVHHPREALLAQLGIHEIVLSWLQRAQLVLCKPVRNDVYRTRTPDELREYVSASQSWLRIWIDCRIRNETIVLAYHCIMVGFLFIRHLILDHFFKI
jgi:hypothetical protein